MENKEQMGSSHIRICNLICLCNLISLCTNTKPNMPCIFKLNFINICMSKDYYCLNVDYSHIHRHIHVQSYVIDVLLCLHLN